MDWNEEGKAVILYLSVNNGLMQYRNWNRERKCLEWLGGNALDERPFSFLLILMAKAVFFLTSVTLILILHRIDTKSMLLRAGKGTGACNHQ